MQLIFQALEQIAKAREIKLTLGFALGIAAALVIGSCGVGLQPSQSLRIGINSWPGYAIAYYAQAANLFKQRGLSVELVQFSNQQDNIRATMRGALDASFVPLWEVMQVDAGEDQPAFIMVADISAGSDGIVARAGINSVADLRGKQVGVKLGTVPHLVLLEALKSAQIPPEEVAIVDISNDLSIQRLQAGRLDAAVVWEPDLSRTATAIGGSVLFTTADVDSLVIDGLASRSRFVSTHSKPLTQFILAWLDAIHAVETQPDEVFEIAAQQLDQSKAAFAADYAGLKKGDRAMNQRMFSEDRLKEAVEEIAQLLAADPRHHRIIRQDIEIESSLVEDAIRSWQA
ncbi:MAG: ABC transporter substrate-binding protein [Leptolyngbya sp. SIO4C1]|nr:ABC transporter substrate-binding protein [Leptolyngbya sp. SIO4C1]